MDGAGEPQQELLKAEAVVSTDGTSLDYNIGIFDPLLSSGDTFEVVIVAVSESGRLLVAFPSAAWNRKVASRRLEAGSIEKPLKLCVPGCTAEDRVNHPGHLQVNV